MTFYQPYQEASQEYQRQSSKPANTLRTAANIGAGIATGSTLLSRAIPFLSKFIPQDMALKGLSKINPTLGKFIASSTNQGFDDNEILDFVKEKVNEATSQEEPAKQSGNIIEQYSPELFQFMKGFIAKGEKPLKAAAAARKKFDKAIRDMEKDHKMSWDEIVSSVFGQEAKGMGESGLKRMLSPAETPVEQQEAQQAASQIMGMGRPQPQQQTQPQPQQMQPNQGGAGQQQFMAILQKINQRLGG